jgi:hypothetical protein
MKIVCILNIYKIEESDTEDMPMTAEENIDIHTSKKNPKEKKEPKVYLGNEQLEKDEELIFDNSAYEMLHRATVEWPSLSIDVL